MNGVAVILFLIAISDGVDGQIEMDCGAAPISWNAATKQATCDRLVVDATECQPSNAVVTADNVHIVCTKSGNLRVTCPGGMSTVGPSADGKYNVYYCQNGLSPPTSLRVLKDPT